MVDAAFAGAYDLLLPDGPLDKLIESVENKPKASRLIDLDDARNLASARRSCVDLRPSPTPRSPRSPATLMSGYVYLSALRFGADALVSMDRDLTVPAPESSPLRVLAPSEFRRPLPPSRLV